MLLTFLFLKIKYYRIPNNRPGRLFILDFFGTAGRSYSGWSFINFSNLEIVNIVCKKNEDIFFVQTIILFTFPRFQSGDLIKSALFDETAITLSTSIFILSFIWVGLLFGTWFEKYQKQTGKL